MIKTSKLQNNDLRKRMQELSGISESVVSMTTPSKLHDRQAKKGHRHTIYDDPTNDMGEDEELNLDEILFELELQSILDEMGYYNDDE